MSQNLTPVLAGRKMSDSLRERLKRTSRYYSPQNPKRQRAESDQSREQETNIPEQNKPVMEDKSNHCEKENDESSQDFEYSDDESNTTTSPIEINRLPIKNVSLELQEVSPERCTNIATKRTVPNEKLAIPKFERKSGKRKTDLVATVEDTTQDSSDDKDAEVKDTIKVETQTQKNQIPLFKRTPVKIVKKSSDNTRMDYSTCSSTLESDPQEKTTTDQSESNEEKIANTEDYEGENTEIMTGEQIDSLSVTELNSLRHNVQHQLEQKKETLRKLKMVKMYRSKNNLTELEHLISKWLGVCHEALEELLNLLPKSEHQQTASVYQLAKYFNLDLNLLHIQPDEDSQDQE